MASSSRCCCYFSFFFRFCCWSRQCGKLFFLLFNNHLMLCVFDFYAIVKIKKWRCWRWWWWSWQLFQSYGKHFHSLHRKKSLTFISTVLKVINKSHCELHRSPFISFHFQLKRCLWLQKKRENWNNFIMITLLLMLYVLQMHSPKIVKLKNRVKLKKAVKRN